MKNQRWEWVKFTVKANFRYLPRLLMAPVVGLYRGYQYFCETMDSMDAEIDAFEQNQRAERNPTRSFNA